MLYLMGTDYKNGNVGYRVMETCTNSSLYGDMAFISKLVNECGLELKNADIVNEQLEAHKWPHGLHNGEQVLRFLLGKAFDDLYVIMNHNGVILYRTAERLKEIVESNKLDNCTYKDGEYFSIDTSELKYTKGFDVEIEKKYKSFVAKAAMLGKDISFDYTVDGEEVKLTQYRGSSNHAVVPGFVTSICCGAFRGMKLESIRLNDGLRYIGADAFQFNNIEELKIPRTVKFMCRSAFNWNSKLINMSSGNINTDNVEILSKDTKIIKE